MISNPLTLLAGITVNAETKSEFIPAGEGPDPDWKMVDNAGHGHFATDDRDNRYPTLTLVYEGCDDPEHDSDCQGGAHFECSICGEVIEPRTETIPARSVPVSVVYTVTDEDRRSTTVYTFGDEKADELRKELRATLRRVLAGTVTAQELRA